uniref:Uncharacterized protein n=1 Tax=Plectus sambesii TaxID=2011161 RepID=A0A914VJ60_9BILA
MTDNTPGVDDGDLLFDELNKTLSVETQPTAAAVGAAFSPINLDDSLSPSEQPYSLDSAATPAAIPIVPPPQSSDILNGSSSPSDSILTDATESSLTNAPNLDKIAKLYEKYSFQCGELERLEKQNEEYREQLLRIIRERDNSEQALKDIKEQTSSRILDLERKNLENDYQLKATKDRMNAQESHFRKTTQDVQTKFNAQIDMLKKSTDTAQREKDEAVVKYAMRESEILKLNGERQKLADQLKQVTVERDALTARLRGSKNEKETVKSSVEQMECQLSDMKRELDSQMNLVKEADIRVKIANKRVEGVEAAHQETKAHLENATKQLARLQEENAAIRADHRKLIGEFQMQNEQSTKEIQIQQQEVSEQESIYKAIVDELDLLKKQHRNTLKDVEALQNELTQLKTDCDRLTEELNAEKSAHAEDRKELNRLKDIESEVESSRKRAEEAEKATAEAREDRDQAEREAADCRKQAERMLEITEQLTEKNSRLTSESDVVRTKLREYSEAETESTRVAGRLSEAERELSQLRACSGAEIESLKRQLDEKIRKVYEAGPGSES